MQRDGPSEAQLGVLGRVGQRGVEDTERFLRAPCLQETLRKRGEEVDVPGVVAQVRVVAGEVDLEHDAHASRW